MPTLTKKRMASGDESVYVDTHWFQAQLADKRLSQRKLAAMMGLDPAAVSLMLRGKRKMVAGEVAVVARLLGVPVDEVMRHAGIDTGLIERGVSSGLGSGAGAGAGVPVVGWVDASGVVKAERSAGPAVVVRPPVSGDLEAVRIQTDGLYDGFVLYYRPCEGVSLEAVGQMCIVETVEGLRLVRYVKRGYEPGKYAIGGWRQDKIDDVGLKTATPILWMKQR